MPTDRAAVDAAARDLFRSLAARPGPLAVRVVVADGRRGVPDPGLGGRGGYADGGRRAGCGEDVLTVVREAGQPLTLRQVVRALRERRAGHSPGTVAKALAGFTAAGELVNPRDRRGDRPPDCRSRHRHPACSTD